jgi:hypothetical protein
MKATKTSKNGKAKAKPATKSNASNGETLHDLRVNALKALKVDPFNRDALRKAAGKAPAKTRTNVIALAKKVQPAGDSQPKKAA